MPRREGDEEAMSTGREERQQFSSSQGRILKGGATLAGRQSSKRSLCIGHLTLSGLPPKKMLVKFLVLQQCRARSALRARARGRAAKKIWGLKPSLSFS